MSNQPQAILFKGERINHRVFSACAAVFIFCATAYADAFQSAAFSSVSSFRANKENIRQTNLFEAYINENEFAKGPMAQTSDSPGDKITDDAVAKHRSKTHTRNQPPKVLSNGGKATLVGAGPGSPDLLTISAHQVITSDPNALVIVDRLVSKEILSLIKGEVRIAKKYPGCAEQAQNEIYDWCREGLENGRHVIRLKIGDPFVFGRGGEEVLKFRSFGVEPTVIPGVSAAFSAPLLGSIPVTHRGVANQVVMCTGYGRDNTCPSLIQYHKEQTVVFLMAVGRLRQLCENLVKLANYPVDTPVAIVERAGCPNQRTIVGTMKTIPDLADKCEVKPPSTIVVGDVVNVLSTEEDFSGVARGDLVSYRVM